MKNNFLSGLVTGILFTIVSISFAAEKTGLQESYTVATSKSKEVEVKLKESMGRQIKSIQFAMDDDAGKEKLKNELLESEISWKAYVEKYCHVISRIYGGNYAGPHEIECHTMQAEAFIKINDGFGF